MICLFGNINGTEGACHLVSNLEPSKKLTLSAADKKGTLQSIEEEGPSTLFKPGNYPGFHVDNEKLGLTREELALTIYPDVYEKFFFNVEHFNWISKQDAYILSVTTQATENGQHRALKTSAKGYEQFQITTTDKKREKHGAASAILLSLQQDHGVNTADLCQVTDTKFPAELATVEKKHPQSRSTMKLAVIYCKKGQTTNLQMFENTPADCSPGFWNFLDALGKPIDLEGWNHYRGDQRPPGEAWYTVWNEIEIIYHVAPKLNAEEKRRLIGNDIPYVFYFDEDPQTTKFDPSGLMSFGEVPQIFTVVQPLGTDPPYFRVGACTKLNIPVFNPISPSEAVNLGLAKGFTLVKLFNGLCKTIYHPPMQRLFLTPRKATLEDIIGRWFELKKQTIFDRVKAPILGKKPKSIFGDALEGLDLIVEQVKPNPSSGQAPPDWALVTSKVLGQGATADEQPSSQVALFRASMKMKPPALPNAPSPREQAAVPPGPVGPVKPTVGTTRSRGQLGLAREGTNSNQEADKRGSDPKPDATSQHPLDLSGQRRRAQAGNLPKIAQSTDRTVNSYVDDSIAEILEAEQRYEEEQAQYEADKKSGPGSTTTTPPAAISGGSSPVSSPRGSGDNPNADEMAGKRRFGKARIKDRGSGPSSTKPHRLDDIPDLDSGFDEKVFNEAREKLKIDVVAVLVGVRLLVSCRQEAEHQTTIHQVLKHLKTMKSSTVEYSKVYGQIHPCPFVCTRLDMLSADILGFIQIQGGRVVFKKDAFEDAMTRIPSTGSEIIQHLNIRVKGI